MKAPTYDSETDSIYFSVRSGKAYETLEINSNILIDLSQRNNSIIGVEIVGASEFLSKLFSRRIGKETMQEKLKMHLKREGEDDILLDFELGKEKYGYVIPRAYRSPVLGA